MLTTRKPVPSKRTRKHLCPNCQDTGVISRLVPRRIGRAIDGKIVYHGTHTVTALYACDCRQGWAK